ncbi:MAG: iron donor protein CyaY [Candidatus Solibacter usitatus]|nr:iron donor protein CyaY [Candidatus Solibacter usitatus]
MLTDQEFRQKCDLCLESLYGELARASENYDFDVEMNNGALTVEFEEPPQRFVVSPNAPVKQIWVSAHVQSFKLDWNGADFILPATGETLREMMTGAIRKLIPDFEP